MRLIIIGNGFDLAHGLKTGFSDFKAYLRLKKEDDFIEKVDKILELNGYQADNDYEWNKIEEIIYKEFNRTTSQDNRDALEELIADLSLKFDNYLKNKILVDIDKVEPLENIKKYFEGEVAILNFNYTNLYKKYCLDLPRFTLNIHGNIEDETDSIVIGYFMDYVISSNEVNYKKRFSNKLICKSALTYKNRDRSLLQETSNFQDGIRNKIDDIVILGYSFGDSDRHIYDIIVNSMIKVSNESTINKGTYEKYKKVKLTIFDYNNDSILKKDKLIGELSKKNNHFQVYVTGYPGYKPILMDLLDYNTEKYK